ncbi:interleukin-17 receptor D [Periophthalmus magnuspinnatus]|uniref:interleukin-17 receptor D n=1 Tax=Periophthalmus magnuspinnatus TaxID=409849 RepID=UPI00145A7548|nr:interleukin-17 receptor D [Periophthalmus magnuspinnatus]
MFCQGAFVLYLLLTEVKILWAVEDANVDAFTPQDCSLECLRQGDPDCKYCRITPGDVQKALGSKGLKTLGSCIPWPCFELMGNEDPDICQHYVHSPNNVTVETLEDPDLSSDTVVVAWRPSPYGIAFLRGFQVSLQVLGGSSVSCQLFLFHRNLSLPSSHAQKVYKSDPFRGLPLGSQYAVTVMALPVPEQWDRFYHSTTFCTRSCAEKNGFDKCKRDWYPQHVTIEQNGTTAAVTFNLAPENLHIRSYFSVCYINSIKKQTNKVDITPNLSTNKTHHTFKLQDLQEGTNYTCEIAADVVDAVRKTFTIHIKEPDSSLSTSPVVLLLPLALALAAVIIVIVVAFTLTKAKMKLLKLHIVPDSDIINEHQESKTQEEVISWPKTRASPPRLLICYSSSDGPAHIKAVMKLGSFIQQHMATQVCLDLWDSLSVAQEGSLAWHSRQIRDCDFVLVMCSPGLSHRLATTEFKENSEEEESSWETDNFTADAAISLIGAEVGRAKARGQDLSKYMAAIFEYSEETDIPTELSLVSHYTLTSDLPLLFSHLHGVSLHRPGGYLKISHISEEGFTKLPAGVALQSAICEAGEVMKARRIVPVH